MPEPAEIAFPLGTPSMSSPSDPFRGVSGVDYDVSMSKKGRELLLPTPSLLV
jgi:hypothetical protein